MSPTAYAPAMHTPRPHGLVSSLVVLTTAFAFAGCASAARQADGAAAGMRISDVRSVAMDLAPCTTTEAQLRKRLGAPTRDGRLHAGRVLSWMAGEDAGGIVRYLAVLVDASGTVVDVYWDLPTEIPWQPQDRCATR